MRILGNPVKRDGAWYVSFAFSDKPIERRFDSLGAANLWVAELRKMGVEVEVEAKHEAKSK
jgi:hypothetical protein